MLWENHGFVQKNAEKHLNGIMQNLLGLLKYAQIVEKNISKTEPTVPCNATGNLSRKKRKKQNI